MLTSTLIKWVVKQSVYSICDTGHPRTSKLRARASHVAGWEGDYQILQSIEDLEYKANEGDAQLWGTGSPEIVIRKNKKRERKKNQTTHQISTYQAANLRTPDKNPAIFNTACSLGLRWVRGVLGLASTGDILTGLYHKKLDFSWLTEKSTLILYVYLYLQYGKQCS